MAVGPCPGGPAHTCPHTGHRSPWDSEGGSSRKTGVERNGEDPAPAKGERALQVIVVPARDARMSSLSLVLIPKRFSERRVISSPPSSEDGHLSQSSRPALAPSTSDGDGNGKEAHQLAEARAETGVGLAPGSCPPDSMGSEERSGDQGKWRAWEQAGPPASPPPPKAGLPGVPSRGGTLRVLEQRCAGTISALCPEPRRARPHLCLWDGS